ncbi:MAG: hypothetical protein ACRDRB_04120 [Pseudonocardiaceae bacterium]
MTAEDFGPFMRALAPRHRVFVVSYCSNGCNGADAAREAGFLDTGTGAIRVRSHRLLHRPDVRAAIREWTLAMIEAKLPVYRELMDEIAENPSHKDQFKALVHVQAISGMAAIHKHEHEHTVIVTDAEKIEKIKQLAAKHNIPLEQVLGDAVDVEFSEVESSFDLSEY